jgi:hypothetical protein
LTIVRFLVAMTAFLALAACDRPEPRTVQEFMADEVALTGTLVRCQDMGSESMQDPECQNARRASERLAALEEEGERKAREAEFERKRAALRDRQDREQAAREAAAAAARAQEEQALLGSMTFEGEAFEGEDPATPSENAAGTVAASEQGDLDPTPGGAPASGASAVDASPEAAPPPPGEAQPDPDEAGPEPVRAADPVPDD